MTCPGRSFFTYKTISYFSILLLLVLLTYILKSNKKEILNYVEGVKVALNITSKQKRWEYKYKQFQQAPQ